MGHRDSSSPADIQDMIGPTAYRNIFTAPTLILSQLRWHSNPAPSDTVAYLIADGRHT